MRLALRAAHQARTTAGRCRRACEGVQIAIIATGRAIRCTWQGRGRIERPSAVRHGT